MSNPMMISLGRFAFYHRNWLFLLLLVVFFLVLPPLAPGRAEVLLNIAGGVSIVAGLFVRMLVIAATPVPRAGTAKRVDAEALRTTGLFSVCRNPLYVGNVLIASGVFLIHGNPLAIVLGILLTVFLYQAIIANEESFLREKFGAQYTAYMQDVNRWLPNLARLPGALAGMHLNLVRWMGIEWSVVFMAALVSGTALWYEAGSAMPPLGALVILLGGLGFAILARSFGHDDNPE